MTILKQKLIHQQLKNSLILSIQNNILSLKSNKFKRYSSKTISNSDKKFSSNHPILQLGQLMGN